METVRREVWYEGRIQGVGFRYTVARIARQFEVSGFVQNLSDGRVHLVCEGQRTEVNEFLSEISDRMESYIRDTRQDTRPETGEFASFEIRY